MGGGGLVVDLISDRAEGGGFGGEGGEEVGVLSMLGWTFG